MIPLQTTPEPTNFVARFLAETFDIPPTYANPVGAAVLGIVVLVAVYAVARAVLVPLADRAMDRRGLDAHAKKPLKKIVTVVVAFVALAAALLDHLGDLHLEALRNRDFHFAHLIPSFD